MKQLFLFFYVYLLFLLVIVQVMFLVGSYTNKEAVSLIAKLRFFGLFNVIYNI